MVGGKVESSLTALLEMDAPSVQKTFHKNHYPRHYLLVICNLPPPPPPPIPIPPTQPRRNAHWLPPLLPPFPVIRDCAAYLVPTAIA
ncbi:hypothetical protein EJ05DRAFT_503544 [Pseudovirgaria hyperparasitica]|uniref:Uncharacterized protein n=1 Tax=Pseudovirgaria hyperparasitica TaxID=470096 RepID=A0A6A6VZD4_9PEZI|nr:uncharacterized protein EJ05DRAFT_503544 [Pseudovirgaria hyperparasitica]KAF2755239.1 hypothetical protein EJ05DRAFT_503544 [Pseudovirgaria hyperparasitica]